VSWGRTVRGAKGTGSPRITYPPAIPTEGVPVPAGTQRERTRKVHTEDGVLDRWARRGAPPLAKRLRRLRRRPTQSREWTA
jgi:hypothetical protein